MSYGANPFSGCAAAATQATCREAETDRGTVSLLGAAGARRVEALLSDGRLVRGGGRTRRRATTVAVAATTAAVLCCDDALTVDRVTRCGRGCIFQRGRRCVGPVGGGGGRSSGGVGWGPLARGAVVGGFGSGIRGKGAPSGKVAGAFILGKQSMLIKSL